MSTALRMLIIVAILVGSQATAEGEAMVAGAGAQSCGKMITDVSDETKAELAAGVYRTWMQGFLSASNLRWIGRQEAGKSISMIDLKDLDGQWLWLKNYCNEHPLESVYKGMDELFFQMLLKHSVELPLPMPEEPTKPQE